MKRFVKFSVLLLVLMAAITPVFANGGGEAAEESGVYQFKLAWGPWDVGSGRIDVAVQPEDPYFKYIEETVGVVPLTQSWEWEGSKGYVQGLKLAMAGGEEFDAIMPWNATFAMELVEADMALPLEDLLPKYPNIWEMYDQKTWDSIKAQQGGHIYYLPQAAPVITVRAGFIRKDWLERVGMEVPTTKEELVEVYRAFKAQDANGNGDPNDEIPVSGREMFRWFDDLFVMHGVVMYEGHPLWSWNEEKGIFESHQVSDEMLAAVQFINELYEEGLMDVTMPAQPNADWTAKISDNRIGHYFHLINEIPNKSAFAFQEGGDKTGESHWAVMAHPPVVESVGMTKNIFPNVQAPRLMILKGAKKPEEILKLVDWANSSEGQIYNTLGIPEVDWKKDASGNITVINEIPPVKFKYAPGVGGTTPDEIVKRSTMGELKIKMMAETAGHFEAPESMFMPPSVYEGYGDYYPNSAPMYREIIGKMITGAVEPTMENWEAYREEWYAAGGQEVTDRATEWYKGFFGK